MSDADPEDGFPVDVQGLPERPALLLRGHGLRLLPGVAVTDGDVPVFGR